ncbi:exported protein of unknown function [Candidatus Filomicrobium marinum]|uniref:Secreted protein n=1 Tax=Candidatus Filomicrobium marinum TaxID=1608628 RepID=A0A0D6JH82_9HYPH|nr:MULTISPECIES: hypothetical protein [Filomicrobium]MCV0369608.1 hypothetical protein [Filomicrobium sp.]CFX46201.1 exported protein of unknown function [Candidatus Filomicrobium marinum]CPR20682.1 exported protein of unknown function [Candidatus Filomicrobium marinum]
MRIVFVLAAVLLAAMSVSVSAGYNRDMICWTLTSGKSACAFMPKHYRLSFVPKPNCAGVFQCQRSQVHFALTRRRLRELSRYVDTSRMRPTHTATLYARLY